MEKMTKREQEVLSIIKHNMRVVPPTQKMIGAFLGITKQTVNAHIKKIERKGFLSDGYPIEMEDNKVDLLYGKEPIFNGTNFNDFNWDVLI